MSRVGLRPRVILLAVALLAFAVASQAATTVLHVEVGDSFAGNIGTAGIDTVQAHFNAVEGTPVRVTARAAPGSTLEPTVTLTDGSGSPVSVGRTLRIEWLPVPNVIHLFTVPSSGNYVAEIGGASGSGEFTATINGSPPSGVALTTISGSVTNSFTGAGIAGVTVTAGTFVLVTDTSGAYAATLPAGNYSVTFEAPEFEVAAEAVELVAGTPTTLNVALSYTEPVIITADVSGDSDPGGTLTATVDAQLRDGSTVQEILWTQKRGAPVTITGAGTDTATVTLPDLSGFKAELFHVLSEPPITEEQLPPNVPLPEGEFPGGLQNRFQVVGLNPFALEEAALVVLEVEVITSSGTYTEEVEVHTTLPWKPTLGINNVPVGVPVLLHGKSSEPARVGYDWTLALPDGSNATLLDATTQNPEFTPDVVGLYEIEVTDPESGGPVTLYVYAGTWRGIIVGQDFADRPVPESSCMSCHSDPEFAPDEFTPWAQTGHAEILTNNLNTSTHYGSSCFGCHSVGYDPDVDNGGFDDAPDYADFLDAGLLNNPGDNWTTMLEQFPHAAQLANIQCENCHGPQSGEPGADTDAHGWRAPFGEPRVDISADVCASCHGEPLRHARFQQWQLSAHANYELAFDEGESGSCARCHTGNGFLEWLPILLGEEPGDPLASIEVTWEPDETHPQTCATCHDPHAIGTTSGAGTNATVRISGDTPPLIAGFTATDVGRGAICMTCHNSRRGLRNDDVFDDLYGTSEAARAPHGSSQTDVLFGQNAYLVPVGTRGGHSTITDTCVSCHMERTPPPNLLSYNQGGSNHTFFAGTEICADCHEGLDASVVQDAVQGFLDDVEELVEEGILELMDQLNNQGYTIDLNGAATITNVANVQELVFGESHGRQSITVTFTNDTTFGPYRLTDVDVTTPGDPPTIHGQLYDYADPSLIKAGWNWILFHNDGSLGVHNPIFAYQALIAARDALLAGPAPTTTFQRGTLQRSVRTPVRNQTTERMLRQLKR